MFLFTGGISLKRILYRHFGHLASVYPLRSTNVPHLAHLYKLQPSYNPFDVSFCSFTHWCLWDVCAACKYCVAFPAFPYTGTYSFYCNPITLWTGMILFHFFFYTFNGSFCLSTVSRTVSSCNSYLFSSCHYNHSYFRLKGSGPYMMTFIF